MFFGKTADTIGEDTMDYKEVITVAVGTYLITPVERTQLPLVVRRSEAQDPRQQQKSPYEQAQPEQRDEKKPQKINKRTMTCIMSDSHIDCRI